MSVFTPLGSFFRRRTAPPPPDVWEIPLGMTRAEWEDLKALRSDDGWDIYLRALDEVTKFVGEAILSASGDESLHFQRGVVAGIRKAALLIDELKMSEEDFKNARARSAKRERAGRTSALFGSPGWSNPIK